MLGHPQSSLNTERYA